jgi:hypothetical protein
MNPAFLSALSAIGMQIPIYIVWITGIILAIVNIKKMPKVSILTLIALVLFLITSVISSIVNVYYPTWAMKSGIPTSQMGLFFIVKGIIGVVFSLACWVMILIAIFSKRRTPAIPPTVLPIP